jgi:hypothetical protein
VATGSLSKTESIRLRGLRRLEEFGDATLPPASERRRHARRLGERITQSRVLVFGCRFVTKA